MRRNISHAVLVAIVILLAFGGGVAIAEEEITLQGLADQISALMERVDALEAMWEGPGAIYLSDDTCEIGRNGEIQDATVLKYKETWDEWPDLDDIDIYQVVYDSDSNRIGIVYEDFWDDRYVTEVWNGCEFIDSSDWWEE